MFEAERGFGIQSFAGFSLLSPSHLSHCRIGFLESGKRLTKDSNVVRQSSENRGEELLLLTAALDRFGALVLFNRLLKACCNLAPSLISAKSFLETLDRLDRLL